MNDILNNSDDDFLSKGFKESSKEEIDEFCEQLDFYSNVSYRLDCFLTKLKLITQGGWKVRYYSLAGFDKKACDILIVSNEVFCYREKKGGSIYVAPMRWYHHLFL